MPVHRPDVGLSFGMGLHYFKSHYRVDLDTCSCISIHEESIAIQVFSVHQVIISIHLFKVSYWDMKVMRLFFC
jgi:hypothetical protein